MLNMDGYEYIAIGQNCWGWGDTVASACIMASKQIRHFGNGFMVYYAHRETSHIGGFFGELNYNENKPPLKLGFITPVIEHAYLRHDKVVVEEVKVGDIFESSITCFLCNGEEAWIYRRLDEKTIQCCACKQNFGIGRMPLLESNGVEDYASVIEDDA